MIDVQVVVIGGGPGGYAAAFLAADLGLKTGARRSRSEPRRRLRLSGCIPSKALLHVANLLSESRHAEAWGITFASPRSISPSFALSRKPSSSG